MSWGIRIVTDIKILRIIPPFLDHHPTKVGVTYHLQQQQQQQQQQAI